MRFAMTGLVVGALALAAPASAHRVWLEQDASGVRLYFGEFASNVREASPGLLDKLDPKVSAVGAAKRPLEVSKTPAAFASAAKLQAGESVVAEDTRYPISISQGKAGPVRSVYQPAARFVPNLAAREAVLDLDVVPTGAPNSFKVIYKGKPLAEAHFALASVSGWSRDFKTDGNGVVVAALPWRGLYVAEVMHTDRTPGKRGEEAYDMATYVTSLTFAHPTGPEAPQGPQPAKSNQ